MTNVSEWSVTAGLNNSSPPNGWPEGMARSAVNDCAREMQAALARWYQDSNGTLVTAGTGNAYTLATNSVYTALNDIPVLVFRTNRANTGAITLNVDGLGGLPVTRGGAAFASGDITNGQLMVVAYNSASGAFDYVGLANAFDSGTRMMFQQTAAPSGWTKEVGAAYNDAALRLTTGTAATGGATAFTSVFTSLTISQDNLPDVDFMQSGASGLSLNSNAINNGTTIVRGGVLSTIQSGTGTGNVAANCSLVTLTVNDTGVDGTVSSGGLGTPLDFAVMYADTIIATKA